MPKWLTAFFLLWPLLLLGFCVSVHTSSRAVENATRVTIAELATNEAAIQRCPQLPEYARTGLKYVDSLCVGGFITMQLRPASRPLELVDVTATGPFPSCIFPVLWSRRMVTVRRVWILEDESLRVCYEP